MSKMFAAQMKPKNANSMRHWFEFAGDFCTCRNGMKSNDSEKSERKIFEMCASAVALVQEFRMWLIFPSAMKICFSNLAIMLQWQTIFAHSKCKWNRLKFLRFFFRIGEWHGFVRCFETVCRIEAFLAYSIYGTLATTKYVQFLNNRPFNLTNCGRAANELVCENVWWKNGTMTAHLICDIKWSTLQVHGVFDILYDSS